jgi:hypothetical protein
MSDEGDGRGSIERRLIRLVDDLGTAALPGESDVLREAADALGECRRAMEAMERRWEGIDPDEVFTFREDSRAIKGIFAALAKLKEGG